MFKKIKAVYVAWKEANKIKEAGMKSGWKTTEFLLTVVTSLISIFVAVQGMISPELVLKICAGMVMAYNVARAITKFTPTTKDDEIMDRIEKLLKDKNLL